MPSTTSPMELMATLGHEYRRIREDRQREGSKGTIRRHIEEQMEKAAEHFERLLEHWVSDEPLRESWRDFFYHDSVQPQQPQLRSPPLFRGRNEAGALIEINETSDKGYDVFVDGVHVEHYDVSWQSQPNHFEPVLVGDWLCTETFQAPSDALEALESFLARSGSAPPWRWATVLFEDGLIDANFGLTARGARSTKKKPIPATETMSGDVINYCVLMANASRARLFTLQGDASERTTFEPLTEVSDLTSGLARATDGQLFSESRPSVQREGPHLPAHGVNDRRESHRRESQRKYIQRVVDAAAKVWSQYDSCRIIVVASPLMLTRLRPAIARRLSGTSGFVVHEYPSDLNWQEAAAVHDVLAKVDLLPTRARRPPVRPMRTPNPWQGEG